MDTPTAQARMVFLAALVGIIMISTVGGAVTESGKARQPRNIYELIYSMEATFGKVLQADELEQFGTMSPKDLRKKNPALYERISGDVKGWTDAWLRDALAHGDQISEERLNEAEHITKQVDAILRKYFEANKWSYRPMQVIFLPPRLLQDERHRENITGGIFIPYYPDAFFATVDWPIPLELILVYESFHFNAIGSPFGGSLSAGVTMSAAQYLVRKYDLVSAGKVNRVDAFPMERKGVEVVLDGIVNRTGRTHDEALKMLLETYLTGRQDEMRKVFGSQSWDRVLRLSHSKKGWQKHRIAKALEK